MSDTALAAPRSTVHVALEGRGYDVEIGPGLIAGAGRLLVPLGARRVGVVTDENVARLHLDPLMASLEAGGLAASSTVVPAGEASKSFAVLEEVSNALLASKVERGDLVLALGGGVVGDLAGFAAAILRRGVRLVQMPTTLLAQVDSSVGGKTGINTRHGKNLIGAFHQPSLVLADADALSTLPLRDFRAGYAEVAKYGLINDAAFFRWLEDNWQEVFEGGPARTKAIAASCANKAGVVARDEFETGERALLNLGHTFGHALEAAVGYDDKRLVHGEGVAIGMALAFRFSAELGLVGADQADRVAAHLKAVGLPTRIQDVPGDLGDARRLLDLMGQDKKVKAGKLTFILARGVGQSFIANDVAPENVLSFLTSELSS
ncbi:3-dehydroquinate synthase [Agaricicola taiwanensis]|uniref:3-dehydroquinate synthase n=1 Tax=Agaricicola taiwanensis TaxID=591372 RepID=A0A8J2YMA1_9RHOB|nr:3-dehydroquinate synthase [Agaricicola taiwanensis]GGE52669.1 3-dehydroquinate synthase [Agaricicola taiwanensis]